MKILYYNWGENSASDMLETLRSFGYDVTVLTGPLHDYFEDKDFTELLLRQLTSASYDFIFTFNFFPVISDAAEGLSVRYVCWVYDCPHYTLYSDSVRNACNYIFLFDREMTFHVRSLGAAHVYHLPLAANTKRLHDALALSRDNYRAPQNFLHEVSFVGSLYENNPFDSVSFLPERLTGYLDAIMCTQKQLWGTDLIGSLMDDDLTAQLSRYIKTERNPHLPDISRLIFANMLKCKITSDERITAVNLLAEFFPTALYSASPQTLCPKADCHGTISYLDTMPSVFYGSKINLNITLRSICSGIPLRAIDILACGGFLLSNYQPELCEYFEAGADFIYFEDLEDMLRQADYFLRHDNDRVEIAANGYRRAAEEFTYVRQVQRMLELLHEP